VLAQAGLSVVVLEREESLGGSCRTAPLTLPGFRHDVCAGVPARPRLAEPSAACRSNATVWSGSGPGLPRASLRRRDAACTRPSLERTAEELGGAPRYLRLMQALLPVADDLFADLLAPPHLPSQPPSSHA
jgi:phytoene dehydrogenase-like protein